MNRAILVIAAVAVASVSAACSSTNSHTAASASGGTKTSPQKLAFVQLQSAPLSNQITIGAQAAASAVGSTVTTQGPATLNPSAAIAALTADTSAGYQGAIADAYPSGLWIEPLAHAQSGGMAVATVDAGSPNSVATFHTGASIEGKGALLAQDFAKVLGPGAKGYIQPGICVPGLDVLTPSITGFTVEMAKLEPGVTVKPAFNVTGQPDTNYSAWSRLITQEPNALAFFGVCDQDAPNLIKVKTANPGSKYLIGNLSGATVAVLQAVQNGTMTAVIDQNGFVQGYIAAKYMLRHLNTKQAMPGGWVSSGLTNVTKGNAAAAIAASQSNTAAAYKAYYAPAISAAEAEIAKGSLPSVKSQLTTLTP